MRIVDCHVHMRAEADPADVLRQMDANGVDRILACSPHERRSLEGTRECLLAAKKLFDAAPDRISGLAFVNPTLDGMADLATEALNDLGFVGIKIIPDHYFLHDERLAPFWERMNDLGASILFHTGILYGFEDGSRFCRPLYLEALYHHPRIRFAMAHVSWPWCEECLAVMGRMRAATRDDGRAWQSYIDLTRGTPPHIRAHAVANAVAFCGPDRLLFGTDCSIPGSLDRQKDHIARDLAIFGGLGLDAAQQERILSGTADDLFPA